MSSAPTMLNHPNVTLQLNGVPGVHESVLLSQLVDPPRQVEVLLQPGDTLAVEEEDLQDHLGVLGVPLSAQPLDAVHR